MTANRVLAIVATICFGVLFVLALASGFKPHDLLYLGLTCLAAAHAV